MIGAWFVRSNRLVWHIADAAFNAVVDADLAHGAERFVVESGDTQRGSQFLVELSQIFEVCRQRGQFHAIVGQQKLLVACVPKAGEPAFEHNGRGDRHLIEVVRSLAKLRAAAVFLDADDAPRAADGKAERRQAFNLLWCKPLFNIPHRALSLVNAESSVKRPAIPAVESTQSKDAVERQTERAGALKERSRPVA